MSEGLEQLLKSQYTCPVESSGSFTLQTDKALEKIAKYQLPYPDAWVVKLAQGVVLSGADELDIKQSSTDTSFVFTASEMPDLNFVTNFFDPTDHGLSWWQSFRSALWAVGLNLQRPFKLDILGQSYFWDGFTLHTLPRNQAHSSNRVRLDVSHRTVEQGKGLPILRTIQAAWLNSGLSTVFSEVMFACPIRVNLDSRRLEGFQRCPSHGFSAKNHPVAMFWVEGEPELGIPPSTRANLGHFVGASQLSGLSEYFDSRPKFESCKAAGLLSAHAYYQSGKHGGWRTESTKSMLYWIRHGVVIQKEEFNVRETCASIALFAPCDHLKTDLTGFGLDENAKQQELSSLCSEIDKCLQSSELDLILHDRESHAALQKVAGGIAASGLLLKFVFPPALFLTAVGATGAIFLASSVAKVDKAINRDLAVLKTEWHSLSQGLLGGQ